MEGAALFLAQFALIGGVLAIAVGIAFARWRVRLRAWSELAARSGLSLEPGNLFSPPRVSGAYRGHHLRLDTFSRGTSKNRTTYTRIVVHLDNRAGVRLALYQEDVFNKIGKMFGQKDVQTGDEEIDRRFMIRCEPEMFAARLFTSINLRSKLLQARSLNLSVEGPELYFEQRGAETNGEYLQFLFDMLIDLAEFVERG
jgi:hypothetical protein